MIWGGKMLRKSNIYLITLLILLGVIAQACSNPGGDQADLPDLGTIKVGYLPVTGYAPFYLGVEKGYFEEQGLEVELERFVSGSKMIAPLSTGQLDVGAGEPGTAMFNAAHLGLEMKAICGLAAQAPGHGGVPFLVRTELYESGEVVEPADLQGKKIAVNIFHGMSEFTVSKAMEQGGLTIDDAELITISFPDMPPAFANGAIDAAPIPYPLAAKSTNDGSAVVFLKGDEIGGTIQNGVIYFGKRFLDPANKEVAVRFMMAYLKGLRELIDENWSNEENLAIISKYTNLPPEVIQSSIKSYYDPNCEFVYPSLEETQAYYVSRGYTEYSEPLPLSEVLDESFREEAVRRIGEYQDKN
jgi:NitT/TauT family transport system substrate-binding protein